MSMRPTEPPVHIPRYPLLRPGLFLVGALCAVFLVRLLEIAFPSPGWAVPGLAAVFVALGAFAWGLVIALVMLAGITTKHVRRWHKKRKYLP